MIYNLIRNYKIGDTITFNDNTKAKIMDYDGVIHGKQTNNNNLVRYQIYKINYKDEIYYASDIALNNRDSSIFKRVVANIGYRGNINYSLFKKEYNLWKNMLYRCYWGNSNIYPYYGAIGITVDPKWHCFELFLYDIVAMNNYDTFKKSNNVYELDIASKQKDIPENQRRYTQGKVLLKQFYNSDVAAALDKFKSGGIKPVGTYIEVPVDKNIDTQQQNSNVVFNPLKDGSYPMEAYEYAIKNPPELPVPNNDDLGYGITRTFNGIHYNNTCVKPKKIIIEPRKKNVMCKIVKK